MSQRPPVAANPAPLTPPPVAHPAVALDSVALLVDCAVCGSTHAPGTDDDPGCDRADF